MGSEQFCGGPFVTHFTSSLKSQLWVLDLVLSTICHITCLSFVCLPSRGSETIHHSLFLYRTFAYRTRYTQSHLMSQATVNYTVKGGFKGEI